MTAIVEDKQGAGRVISDKPIDSLGKVGERPGIGNLVLSDFEFEHL